MTWAPGAPWWPRPSTPCWQGRRARWWVCSQLGWWTTWRTWRRSLGGNTSQHFKIWRRWRLLLDCGDGGIVSLGFCSLVCSCRWDQGYITSMILKSEFQSLVVRCWQVWLREKEGWRSASQLPSTPFLPFSSCSTSRSTSTKTSTRLVSSCFGENCHETLSPRLRSYKTQVYKIFLLQRFCGSELHNTLWCKSQKWKDARCIVDGLADYFLDLRSLI